jgi:hypothetical protein
VEGVGNGLVVGKDDEMSSFHHMAEMLYSIVDREQLAILGAVTLLGCVKF